MIRLATVEEAGIVWERGVAEIARVEKESGRTLPMFPGFGSVQADIAGGRLWFIDDADETVVLNAYFDNGECFVPWVLGRSAREIEYLKFLLAELLNRYGDVFGNYAAGHQYSDDADQLLPVEKRGTSSRVRLSDAKKVLDRLNNDGTPRTGRR